VTRLELFGVGAAIGGTIGLGLALYVKYVMIPGMFSAPPAPATLPTAPQPVPAQTPTQPVSGGA
jgi:hypothetical protein